MRWRRLIVSRRRPRSGQRVLPYLERRQRLDRRFKRLILALTIICVVAVLAGTGIGRYASRRVALGAKTTATRLIGLPPDRSLVDEQWRLQRTQGTTRLRQVYGEVYEKTKPK